MKLLEALVVPQLPPEVVNVNVTDPEYPVGGVYVAFRVVLFGLKVPPIPPSDQTPPVAVPPTDPPSAAEVELTQIEDKAVPALAVAVCGVILPDEVSALFPQTFPALTETVPVPVPMVMVAEAVP